MKNNGITTRLVHADRKLNRPADGAVHTSTSNSVLFEYDDVNDLIDVFQGKKAGHVYSRSSSSSNTALQTMINDIEGGVGAVTFATGMAAISSTLFALLKAGDHIIVSHFLFGNTRSYMQTLQKLGIEISFVDVTDVENVSRVIQSNTRVLFTETIANPVTQVADLEAIGQCCQRHNIVYMIDNTMTPSMVFDPRSVHASLTVSSLTKYYAGHGHVLGGVLVDMGTFDWAGFPNVDDHYRTVSIEQQGLTQIRKKGLRDFGATLPPQSAHQVSVGMETMALRVQRCSDNAMRLATYLQGHDKVKHVYYPGLTDHPQHVRSRELFGDQYGGILSLDLQNGLDLVRFLNTLKLVITATHLGDTRTLALPVANTIFFENTASQRADMGISDTMIRVSVGIEDFDDLVADFEAAFALI